MEIEVWVDFNDTDGSGNLVALLEFAEVDVRPGQRVVLGDGSGDVCEGIVREVSSDAMLIGVVRGTFTDASAAKHAHA